MSSLVENDLDKITSDILNLKISPSKKEFTVEEINIRINNEICIKTLKELTDEKERSL